MIDCKTLQDFSQLWVGFSGGLDSTVLLHLLYSQAEKLPPIQAIHIHHGISPNADFWQQHCKKICALWKIPLIIRNVELGKISEESAREARYAVFGEYVGTEEVLLTAHHADDQAETLLLQLFRGAGLDGLGAMKELTPFGSGTLLRPLLDMSRKELEAYAAEHALVWIEDESNTDEKYARNYLRQTLFPLIQEKWPGAVKTLNRTARLAQDSKVCLDDLAMQDMLFQTDISQFSLKAMENLASVNASPLCHPREGGYPFSSTHRTVLRIDSCLRRNDKSRKMMNLSRERIMNCLRFWIKQNGINLPSAMTLERIYQEVMLARSDAAPEVTFGKHIVRRYEDKLYLDKKRKAQKPEIIPWPDFPESIEGFSGKGTVSGKVEIRFRKGGESFIWHGQTKSLKKLFQQWKIPPWRRGDIPLVFVDERLAVVVGYAVGDDFQGMEVY